MSYRKITVDGQEYEYTIGSAMVKVKGMDAAMREEVGETVWIDDIEKIMITPRHVADWIKAKRDQSSALPSKSKTRRGS